MTIIDNMWLYTQFSVLYMLNIYNYFLQWFLNRVRREEQNLLKFSEPHFS